MDTIKGIVLSRLFLLFAACSRTDNIPSAELQAQVANELGLAFEPRNTQREAPGYWHFWATSLTVDVPEGSTFDQIKTLAVAKYRLQHPPTPKPTP
jgi:hypothetical protein